MWKFTRLMVSLPNYIIETCTWVYLQTTAWAYPASDARQGYINIISYCLNVIQCNKPSWTGTRYVHLQKPLMIRLTIIYYWLKYVMCRRNRTVRIWHPHLLSYLKTGLSHTEFWSWKVVVPGTVSYQYIKSNPMCPRPHPDRKSQGTVSPGYHRI